VSDWGNVVTLSKVDSIPQSLRSPTEATDLLMSVRAHFQSIIELDTGAVVGYEALARGPAGSALERPDQLFAEARRIGKLRELDMACRTAALSEARSAGLRHPHTLFVNVEPETLDGGAFAPDTVTSRLPFRVVVELTERELTARPAALLNTVSRVRAAGWGIALDDVGADPASLALLPLLQPDVIKLDLRLIQSRPDAEIAAVMNAVSAEAERSGTVILAEGIETAAHLQTARAFGATLGQGWYFSRAEPLTEPVPFRANSPIPLRSAALLPAESSEVQSPYEVVAARRETRAAIKSLLIEVSKQLEQQAIGSGRSALVLSTFQEGHFFTPATTRRYARLAESAAFVGVLAHGMTGSPLPGVHGAELAEDDPVIGEWDIAVLGPHFAACLVARDLGDDGPDALRRFEFAVSHERELVVAVAAGLMRRIQAQQPAAPRAIAPPSPRGPAQP
jgi:EAL domain-containing protein (putative c-di-GMP-specific phosphodiesterase class I)/DICT domain-containing protein